MSAVLTNVDLLEPFSEDVRGRYRPDEVAHQDDGKFYQKVHVDPEAWESYKQELEMSTSRVDAPIKKSIQFCGKIPVIIQ